MQIKRTVAQRLGNSPKVTQHVSGQLNRDQAAWFPPLSNPMGQDKLSN